MFLSLVVFIWSSYKDKFGHLFSDIVLCSTKTTNFFISRSKIFEALSLKDKFNGEKGDVLNQQFQFNFEGGGGGGVLSPFPSINFRTMPQPVFKWHVGLSKITEYKGSTNPFFEN